MASTRATIKQLSYNIGISGRNNRTRKSFDLLAKKWFYDLMKRELSVVHRILCVLVVRPRRAWSIRVELMEELYR